jgi:nitroreductase
VSSLRALRRAEGTDLSAYTQERLSLGCVMENMWLMAQSLGIGLQILSVFSSEPVEREIRRILDFPPHFKIAYGCRLGYPAATHDYVRVRRTSDEFVHRNGYAKKGLG